MQTPATVALDEAGIRYRTTEYDVDGTDHHFGDRLVEALGLDPGTVGKTLIATLDDGRHVIAVVPVSGSLDLKALARAAGVKRTAMADAPTAERLTGSVLGGIAPLGHRRQFPVFLDQHLVVTEEVHVSAGRRGLELSLAPGDLITATNAVVADLSSGDATR